MNVYTAGYIVDNFAIDDIIEIANIDSDSINTNNVSDDVIISFMQYLNDNRDQTLRQLNNSCPHSLRICLDSITQFIVGRTRMAGSS